MSDLTYPEVGATASDLSLGYHHLRSSRTIGHGHAAFDTASEVLLSWRMHQRRAECRGFTCGTLPRHPECGEERFVVEPDPQTQAVTATITAFSKPSTWIVRAGGPVPELLQAHMTKRYLRALDERQHP